MSYILEALKKAEAERERSTIPGLSTAQNNSTIYITRQSNAKAWWIAGALAVSLAAVLVAWTLRAPGSAANPPVPVAAQTPAAPAALPALAAAVATPAPAPVPALNPVPVAQAVTPPAREVPRSAVVPVVVAAASSKPEPVKAPAMAPAAPAAAPIAAAPAPAAVAPVAVSTPVTAVRPAGSAVPQYADLPDAIKRQIPPLHISGAVYSDSPPEWTLIINDQIMSRGSQVAPDVRLEEVTATSATFNFKGQRFRMDR